MGGSPIPCTLKMRAICFLRALEFYLDTPTCVSFLTNPPFNINKTFPRAFFERSRWSGLKGQDRNISTTSCYNSLRETQLLERRGAGDAECRRHRSELLTHLCAARDVGTTSAVGQTLSHTHRRGKAGHWISRMAIRFLPLVLSFLCLGQKSKASWG